LKKENFPRRAVSLLLALALCLGMLPFSATAASQENSYHDPAVGWLDTAGRANTFNTNATVTESTSYCRYCTQQQNGNAGAEPHIFTPCRTFRVPEYTRDGISDASRNIQYSDGTMKGGESVGNIMYQSPNAGGIYTGYHWTKTMCLKCGRINTNNYTTDYCYLKDVYILFDCASDFDQQTLPEETAWEYLDDSHHYKTVTTGTYCGFCFGTHKTKTTKLESHTMSQTVRSELSHDRFVIFNTCSGCDFSKTSYVLAKSVAANYEGVADGNPHTIKVSDLSERGVTTAIRYGTSADSCTLTSAPNYTEPGSYPVYYKITYTYQGTDMVEDGVAYVRLRESEDDSCPCGCGDPDCGCQDANCGGNCCNKPCGSHQFTQLDKIAPTCQSLGYTRYLCVGCGKIEKRDYVNASGHLWQSVPIREATCEADGKTLEICGRCGEVNVKSTPKGEHEYSTHTVKATCTNPGYTVKECSVCGDRHVTDITNALPHDYKAKVNPATCDKGGNTLHLCEGCGSSFVSDYTEPLGHSWDEGTTVANSTCTGEGVKEYRCTRCGFHRLEGDAASGHSPGAPATCTDPQLCKKCGAVIAKALGHDYPSEVTDPTCTEMGYTTFTCSRCGKSYKSEYTAAAGHKETDWIVDREPTAESEGEKHKECEACGEKLETEMIPKLGTERHEAYIVGYPDGTFGPENSMTRAEAAAIFARLLAEEKGHTLSRSSATRFSDVPGNSWYSGCVRYLSNYNVVNGRTEKVFAPSAPVTRSEFVTMAVRFYATYGKGKGKDSGEYVGFGDVSPANWAAKYIRQAAVSGWISGYKDGTFRGENEITRAEAVAIVNRLLGWKADREYISENPYQLTEFPDVTPRHWAYWEIVEAANSHTAALVDTAESWQEK